MILPLKYCINYLLSCNTAPRRTNKTADASPNCNIPGPVPA